jgi:hypothetical protein
MELKEAFVPQDNFMDLSFTERAILSMFLA